MGFFGFNNKKRSSIGGDFDGDGVKNRKDCEPLNFRKQGAKHRKVKAYMKKEGISQDSASPNMVAHMANEIGVELTSEDVVSISDSY